MLRSPNPVVEVTGCDTTPPVTNHVLSAEDDCEQDGWYNKDVLLTLNASDDKSGVEKDRIIYVTNNGVSDGVWNEYSGPVTFREEGSYTIKYRSTDKASNVEAEKSVSFNIDKTKPTLNLTLDRTVLWPPNHKLVPIKVTVDAKDPNGSGIKSYSVSFHYSAMNLITDWVMEIRKMIFKTLHLTQMIDHFHCVLKDQGTVREECIPSPIKY